MLAAAPTATLDDIRQVVARHWGFRSFRPLQAEAMQAVLDRRDSLVVLPTGGGKSLCYQAPALAAAETTVVVSPLISLMKDQVDALRANGVAAGQLNSSMSAEEQRSCERDLLAGKLRLLFVSPERLLTGTFVGLLRRLGVRSFAIDEAHCISHWGHDFRAEYRQMGRLKELFPEATIHAYTATATEPVRRDIVGQLRLDHPVVLVGSFDRPNLTYRVVPRGSVAAQTLEVIDRHSNEAGIIYCIRRRDVDELTAALKEQGRHALPYHAGLTAEERHATQEAFAAEECNLVVATVAFGMGIDRSNVRFVLHTGMPKSLEHYQQETGRAGRDGLEAECVLLYSRADHAAWLRLIQKSAADSGTDPAFIQVARRHLDEMQRYCQPTACRHRTLVEYFGQQYPAGACQACDVCLGGIDLHPEGNTVAQKIISCVARVKERFGAGHVTSVLRGEDTEAVRKNRHDQLSTFGLLAETSKSELRDWIDQLVGHGVLTRAGDEYPVLVLNEASWEVLRGQRTVSLTRAPKVVRPGRSQADTTSWEGVDRELFERLRGLRKDWADARGVPPYVIFSDATLRALAQMRPASLERLRWVPGIGDAKLQEFGAQLLTALDQHCGERGLTRDQFAAAQPASAERDKLSDSAERAARSFRNGMGVDEVARQMGRARSTVIGYLRDFVRLERPASVLPWVSSDVYQRIAQTAKRLQTQRLKPIFVELEGKISYDEIGIVMAHLAGGDGEGVVPASGSGRASQISCDAAYT
ncbi:MAG: DNA helicase RecQ [Planctomycetes bacterium]|nr:DNA helicase RecQ [Planctomycetota bacterium]